jgi:uncharacterized protein YgbK (DUF1537 family)
VTERPRGTPRIGIVADDLTSAGDGAAPFRAAGFRTLISLALTGAAETGSNSGVTAVDADSRARSATDAARRTTAAVYQLADADVLVKTVDSTLRGHLVAEVEAALFASGRSTAVLAPAFPSRGRLTEQGIQLLDGRPVHESWFGRDPHHPVRCSDLRRLFPGAPVVPAGSARTMLAPHLGVARHIIADAGSDADLDEIVAAVPRTGQVLWIGSPGLAAALARRLAPTVTAGPRPTRGGGSRTLLVVGSVHPASEAQVRRLCRATGATAVRVTSANEPSGWPRRGPVVLRGPVDWAVPASARAVIAASASRLIREHAVESMVLTGGETARAVLEAVGARTFELAAEFEPGVAIAVLDQPRPIPVVVKAGGFGDEDLLVRLWNQLAMTGAQP